MIIGLSGLARSGKSAVTRFLRENHGFTEVSFADPMKKFCGELFQFTEEQLYGKAKEQPDPRYNGLTPRHALQQLGTQWGRECYPDIWIEYAMRQARSLADVVISDCRFKNECEAIWKEGGEVWRIVRPEAGLWGVASTHASENDLTDDGVYDRVINNQGGSLEDLAALVARAVSK